ncbi:MAG: GWxTD domain-containing protein [Terriglobales bacterium]
MQLQQSGRVFCSWVRGLSLLTLLLALLTGAAVAGVSKKDLQNLPPTYRKWLTEEVPYIITDEEKEAFVHLSSDEAREKFIEHFWEIRNPSPGSPTNSYKDEIYRRIAYANQWYGHFSGDEGWRTDRGRVYITLGAPQQTGKYLGFANIRPMEIWFYSNDNPALPPFFYVIFYQRENGAEFRLFSPFMDGPEKLVTGPTEGDRVSSWNQIDHDAGREVARTVLSLLPDEPVDYQSATASMASDMLLNNIRGLANHPLNKDMLRERSALLESVSHRVILHGDYLDVLMVPLVDASGETNVHYVLRMKRPEDFSLAEGANSKYYYSATVSARVLTPEGKLLFTQQRKLSEYVDDRTYIRLKSRVFGYEGLLPLPPGKYKIEFQLGDEIKHTTFPAQREVVVPARPSNGLRITEVVPFSEAVSGQPAYLPFSVAGVRFTPAMDSLTLTPGQDLEFFYQLWRAPKDPAHASDGNLQVEYSYGRMGLHDTKTITEDLPENQFDASGGLINGKKIPTAELQPGGYRMAITITDPATHTRSVASFQFRIADSGASPQIWDVIDPQAAEDFQKGTREHQRALCYVALGDQEAALNVLRKAYSKNPDEPTRDKLVDLLYSRQAFSEVADLYARGGVTDQTDEKAILDMAESFSRLGQVGKSIKLLESALPLRPSSALYLGLARYYQQSGEAQKAAEMEQKAKAFAAEPTT